MIPWRHLQAGGRISCPELFPSYFCRGVCGSLRLSKAPCFSGTAVHRCVCVCVNPFDNSRQTLLTYMTYFIVLSRVQPSEGGARGCGHLALAAMIASYPKGLLCCEPTKLFEEVCLAPRLFGHVCVLKPSVVHCAVLYATMLARVVEDGTCRCRVDVGVVCFCHFRHVGFFIHGRDTDWILNSRRFKSACLLKLVNQLCSFRERHSMVCPRFTFNSHLQSCEFCVVFKLYSSLAIMRAFWRFLRHRRVLQCVKGMFYQQ